MSRDLADVECGGRRRLLALVEDSEELNADPPTTEGDWPVRLLPQWDTQTMTHNDKSWVVPDAAEERLVWRKAAVNAPTVVARGRFVATWAHKTTAKGVKITVTPLSAWRARFLRPVERESKAFAAHLGRDQVTVDLAAPT